MRVFDILQHVLSLTSTTNGIDEKKIRSLFGPSLSLNAEIILPSDGNFSQKLTPRWTNYLSPSYVGAIKPATETDVQNIVKISAKNSIPFLATGGGHGFSDFSTFDGLSIDLSKFNTVHLDAARNRITVGGSTRVSQLIDPLYNAGKELPLGSCKCVGLVGATIGGGIGALHGVRGLLSDALESVRLVTAAGDIVEATTTQNSDLFWGIRGAGSNFGIIISATYKLYEATNGGQAVNADFVFPASANASFWQVMKEFDDTLPSQLAITAVAIFNRTSNEPIITVNAILYGPLEESKPYLEPFFALNPTRSQVITVPQNKLFDAAFFSFFGLDNGACTPNQHLNIYTLGLKHYSPPTFELFFANITDFWIANPDFQGRLLLQRYSNAVVESVPDSETAYAYRDVKTYMNIEGFYTDTELDDGVNEFVTAARTEFAKTSGFEALAVYSNYAHGDEGPEAWYGARKLGRLAALKRKWDPDALFSAHLPVPLEYGGGSL